MHNPFASPDWRLPVSTSFTVVYGWGGLFLFVPGLLGCVGYAVEGIMGVVDFNWFLIVGIPCLVSIIVFATVPLVQFRSLVIRRKNILEFMGVMPKWGGYLRVEVTRVEALTPLVFVKRGRFSYKSVPAVYVEGDFWKGRRLSIVGWRGDPWRDVLDWAEDLNRIRREIDPSLPPIRVGDFAVWDPLNLPETPSKSEATGQTSTVGPMSGST